MNRRFNLLSVFVFVLLTGIIPSSICSSAFAQTGTREYQEPKAKTGQIDWSTTAGGKQYVTTLKISRLAATPKWGEDKENPPLSARKAITIAREVFSKLAPYGEETKLNSPSLKLRESNGRWFWVVYFSPNDFRLFNSTFPVVVLMDGTPVLPAKSLASGFGSGQQKNVKE